MSSALDALKLRAEVKQFELVGYSGGAAVALILAAERDDVFQVQTIAGNVDPAAWALAKGVSPLTGSLDPLDYRKKLRFLAQRHYVGSDDNVVAPSLVRTYAHKIRATCVDIVEVSADHFQGYAEPWLVSSRQPINCNNPR